MGFIASIVGAVIGPLVSLFGKALAVWGAFRTGKTQGRQEEHIRQEEAWNATQRNVEKAADVADRRSGDDVRERLRQRAAGLAASKSDPVQRR